MNYSPKQNQQCRDQIQESIIKEKPDVSWDSIVGLDSVKSSLEQAIILPRKFPQLFTEKRKPWRSLLLFGPPGTGKSHMFVCFYIFGSHSLHFLVPRLWLQCVILHSSPSLLPT